MRNADTIIRMDSTARLSRVIQYDKTIYLSGITGAEGGPDIEAQTRKVLEKLDAYLARCGVDRSSLLSVQIWLKDIERDFAGLNKIWDAWTPEQGAPTRAAGESKMGDPAVLVEIIATAAAAK